MKNYLALARVSSEEQEHGFSLDIQEDALREWAVKNNAAITKMYRVAETAHKSEKRKTFHEMLDYARKKKNGVDGLLFYKVDRAARNMKDWIDLVDLRDKHGVEIVCITEPFDETPAGKLNSNMLAAISQFYSDQLSIRTAEGVERRVRTGLFSGWAPYGYDNYREHGRGLVRVNPTEADNVRRIFNLYAYHRHSLDSLVSTLRNEGRIYSEKHPDFVRSKLYSILTDRSYIGEIKFRGEWVEGKHEHIVELATFDRVQVLLGNKSHHNHRSVYGNGLITCGHCGRPVLCEVKCKGGREYHYYHCTNYTKGDHPRERTTGIELDKQMLALFDKLRIEDKKALQWLQRVIRDKAKAEVAENTAQLHELNRQMGQVNKDRDALLTLRMHGEIEADTYSRKDGELRNLMKRLKLRLDSQEQQKTEIGDTAMKVLELSQCLKEKWVTADIAEKRVILEIVCLNLTLKNASLEISMRKPFDAIAEGLVLKNGAEERT